MLDFEAASKIFSYDQDTGVMTWVARPSKRVRLGSEAGSMNAYGYLRVRVEGRSYLVHRLAWLLSRGHWPTNQIDHINGIRTDNRISNLREATPLENQQNLKLRKNNSSGFIGVRKSLARWQALIAVGGKRICLGSYATPEDAAEAYRLAKLKYHTFQPVSRAA